MTQIPKQLFFILTLCFSLLAVLKVNAQSPAEKEGAIRELIELSGVRSSLKPAMQNMISIMKSSNTTVDIPDEFWDEFTSDTNIDKFVEAYEPIYGKHYSHQEVLDISTFYRSQSGKSMVEKMPAVMAESMQVGSQLGQELAKKIAEKMANY